MAKDLLAPLGSLWRRKGADQVYEVTSLSNGMVWLQSETEKIPVNPHVLASAFEPVAQTWHARILRGSPL